jgi:hypothetical protein
VDFKEPGYAASIVIDRATGRLDVTESRMGLAAIVNDRHMPASRGRPWSNAIVPP